MPRKPKQHFKIVALLGRIKSPISRLVPILQDSKSSRCFALGSGLEESFSPDELDELVQTNQAVMLKRACDLKKANSHLDDPTVVSKEQTPITLPFYALYKDDRQENVVASPPEGMQSDAWPEAIEIEGGKRVVVLCNDEAKAYFKEAFEEWEYSLLKVLKQAVFSPFVESLDVYTTPFVQKMATLLLDVAYDRETSERAIVHGAMVRRHDKRRERKWHYWVTLACRAWGLNTTTEHWAEQMEGMLTSLVLHAKEQKFIQHSRRMPSPQQAEVSSSAVGVNVLIAPSSQPQNPSNWGRLAPRAAQAPRGYFGVASQVPDNQDDPLADIYTQVAESE